MTAEQRKLFMPRRDWRINPALLRTTLKGESEAICAQRPYAESSWWNRRPAKSHRPPIPVRGVVTSLVFTIYYPNSSSTPAHNLTLDEAAIEDTAALYLLIPDGQRIASGPTPRGHSVPTFYRLPKGETAAEPVCARTTGGTPADWLLSFGVCGCPKPGRKSTS